VGCVLFTAPRAWDPCQPPLLPPLPVASCMAPLSAAPACVCLPPFPCVCPACPLRTASAVYACPAQTQVLDVYNAKLAKLKETMESLGYPFTPPSMSPEMEKAFMEGETFNYDIVFGHFETEGLNLKGDLRKHHTEAPHRLISGVWDLMRSSLPSERWRFVVSWNVSTGTRAQCIVCAPACACRS
jgi:hypothetical protein